MLIKIIIMFASFVATFFNFMALNSSRTKTKQTSLASSYNQYDVLAATSINNDTKMQYLALS